MVDHRHIQAGNTCSPRLCGEVLIRVTRPQRVRGNQQDHADILPEAAASVGTAGHTFSQLSGATTCRHLMQRRTDVR
ncbi:hypothetical protein GCM10028790_34880 [Micromonospora taraxaci]